MTHSEPQPLLVTGASGFLGSEIVRLAIGQGVKVRRLVRTPELDDPESDQVVANILQPESLPHAFEGTSAVIHCAGLAHVFGPASRDSARFEATNAQGTANVVRAAIQAGVPRIILVSSVAVYGDSAGIDRSEDSPCNPVTPYGRSKWLAEQHAIHEVSGTGTSLAILRVATLYGEGDRGNVSKLIRAVERFPFVTVNKSANRKSLLHKSDAARACLVAALASRPGVAVCNVSSSPVTMHKLIAAIRHSLGQTAPALSLPTPILQRCASLASALGNSGQLAATLAKFTSDDVYSGARFQRIFGFDTQVDLREGIQRQVSWQRSNR